MSGTTLELTKPVGMLSKKVKIEDYKNLFASLATLAINAATAQWSEAAKSIADTLAAFGIANSEEELAWLLVNRSMIQAISTLVYENRSLIKVGSEEEFLTKADELFISAEISIDADFFENPKKSNIVLEMQNLLRDWLGCVGISKINSDAIVHRLPSFFIYELNDEWRRNENRYRPIVDYYNTPFIKSTLREQEWERYSAYLEKQINESIFGEAFGLSQMYIPLCAYYVEKDKAKENNKGSLDSATRKNRQVVVDLENHIAEWIRKKDKNDPIKVISGGPGSGKSSFAKILTAKLAQNHNVLFIPLHLFDLKSDLGESINSFVKLQGFFSTNPYETENKLIILFDGLDELTQQGKACTEAAKQFTEEVQRHIHIKNSRKLSLQVIITGRELVVQSNESSFRTDGTIIHVLPYYISNEEKKKFVDTNNLLNEDKRNAWWKNYGNIIGHGYKALPEELQGEKLDELTSHPLLNYLIALSYDRKKISFKEDTNMNIVYADLINAVYERSYAGDIHKAIRGITEEQFNLVLEEIAVSAWHGAGRTTTVKEIEDHCRESNMFAPLEEFQEGAQTGVTNLLAAFYFRQSGLNVSGEKTFEFTHKSFCEYLISKRIVRQLSMSAEMLADGKKNTYHGWTERIALHNWAILCGKSALDFYIHNFLDDEIKLQSKENIDIRDWQKMLCCLIEYMLRNGMPFESFLSRPNFLEESRQSRNAEESLLATLSVCSKITNEISHINWGGDTVAGTWIGKLQEQRNSARIFVLKCLNNLDLSKCTLDIKDFYGANLSCSDLTRSEMYFSNLHYANLVKANLQEIYSNRIILRGANLQGANLQGANLEEADLRGANLEEADLGGAILQEADLEGANLQGANLRGAALERANLQGANLRHALIYEEALKKCKTRGAKLLDVFIEKKGGRK